MGAVWCLLTGGEPLLRDDFEELYLGLKRLGLLVSVFTNACLVTPAHVELFRRYPPRDIEVSVYGATRETYERVTRRPGSYDAFVRGLDLLLASGVPVRLKAMALRSTAPRARGDLRLLPRADQGLLPLRPAAAPALRRRRGAQRGDPRRAPLAGGGRGRGARRRAALRRAPEGLQRRHPHLRADGEPHRHPDGWCATTSSTAAPATAASRVGYDGTFRLCSSLWHPATW